MKYKDLLLLFAEPYIFFVLFLLFTGIIVPLGDGVLNFSNNYGVFIYVGGYKYLIGSSLIIIALYGLYIIYKSKDQRRYICLDCELIVYGKKGNIPLCKKCGREMKISWKE